MPSLTLDWTLSILGTPITRAASITGKHGFVAEFDAELGIDYWADADGEYGWELDSVTVEWNTPPTRLIITQDSDPLLWPILLRGFKADETAIAERILERIHADESDELYAREAAE